MHKHKAQNAVVLGLEVADGMVKTIRKQRVQIRLLRIRFLSDHLNLLEHNECR